MTTAKTEPVNPTSAPADSKTTAKTEPVNPPSVPADPKTTAKTEPVNPTSAPADSKTTAKTEQAKLPPTPPVRLEQFLKESGPATTTDFALLVIWAFLAGFAERLVPDALTRLVARTEMKSEG
jgi:hypothetical protein